MPENHPSRMEQPFQTTKTKYILWLAMHLREGKKPATVDQISLALEHVNNPIPHAEISRVIDKLNEVMPRTQNIHAFFPTGTRTTITDAFYEAATVIKNGKPTPRTETPFLKKMTPSNKKPTPPIQPHEKWEQELEAFLDDPFISDAQKNPALSWIRAVFFPNEIKKGHVQSPQEFWLRQKITSNPRLKRLITRALLARAKESGLRGESVETYGAIVRRAGKYHDAKREPTTPDTAFIFLRRGLATNREKENQFKQRYRSRRMGRK